MTRGEGRGRERWKEGEVSIQGTCIKDPWAWTTGKGLTVGTGLEGPGLWRAIGTTVIEQQ